MCNLMFLWGEGGGGEIHIFVEYFHFWVMHNAYPKEENKQGVATLPSPLPSKPILDLRVFTFLEKKEKLKNSLDKLKFSIF